MNNIEDTKNPSDVKETKTDDQGLTKRDRPLRKRSNKVNYNILDHGDSSDHDEDDYIEPKDGGKKVGKRGRKKAGNASDIPFITKKLGKESKGAIGEFAIQIEDDTVGDPASDEIDKLMTGLKNGRSKGRNVQVEGNGHDEIGQVVDLGELKKDVVSNSKLLLALIEICINAKNYGINLQNKSRIFWDEVYSNKDFESILKNFKAETLRKYWRIISDIGDLKSVIETIKSFEDVINQENAK
jgi:hypothetical protein